MPRHKACGDALTPRALGELARLGIDESHLAPLKPHRTDGIVMRHGARELAIAWPAHPDFADHGLVVRRDRLDEALRRTAADAGARVLMGHEATAPIVERGFVRGASTSVVDPDGAAAGVRPITSRFVVVADGANSSFGRAVGTSRDHNWPYGIATRSYWASPRHDEPWIESVLGPPDVHGTPIAGYGWVIPLGDGTVNAGVALLSTYRDVKGVNALKLLDAFARSIADRWSIDPDAQLKAPTRFRVPLGGSVGPKMGPTFLVAGDAAGMASPFNGDGVDAALMTGRLAGTVLDEALTTGNSTTLQRYPTLLADEVGRSHKVGRLSARFLGRPAILGPALRLGMRSDRVMGAVLRLAADELRDGPDAGGAERTYAVVSTLARAAPSW